MRWRRFVARALVWQGAWLAIMFGFLHPEAMLQWLQHLSFAIWTVFAFWYGIRIRWNENPYGINTMVATAAFWLILLLVQVGIFWPEAEWRLWLRWPIYLLVAAAGAQRLWFMWHRHDEDTGAGTGTRGHPKTPDAVPASGARPNHEGGPDVD